MNIISVTHANDIDGLGSAALIKIKYKVPSERIFFTDYSEKGVAYVRKAVERIASKEKGTVLFLTDLGVDRILVSHYRKMIQKVKRNGGRVIWLDHHIWTEYALQEVAGICDVAIVGENEKYCATEITYRNLKVKGKFAKEFSDLVHYSDFYLKPPKKETARLIGIYDMSIMLCNTLEPYEKRDHALRHIVEVLASRRFSDKKILGDARKFGKINEERVTRMLKNLYKAGDNAYIGFSQNLKSTEGCVAIMDKTGCDLGIYVNIVNGTAHLRSRRCDTTKLSMPLGGGGHSHASGFPVNMKRFNKFKGESDRKKFVEFISGRIKRSY